MHHSHRRKTYRYLYTLCRRYLQQLRRDAVSAQYRSQSSPPVNRGAVAKDLEGTTIGIYRDWRKTGRCATKDSCSWRHPPEYRGIGSFKDKGKGRGRGGRGNGKGKGKGKGRGKGKGKRDGKNGGKGGGKKGGGKKGGKRSWSRTPGGAVPPPRNGSPAGRRSSSKDPTKVCILYTKGTCKKSHQDCPLIHNPTCIFHKAGQCRDGARCMFPHRNTEGVLAVQQAGKKLIAAEQLKAENAAKEAEKPDPKAKAKAKAKGKGATKK